MGVDPLALLNGNMLFDGVGVPSLWGYNHFNENVEDLNQRLIDTTWELQSFKVHARDELNKKQEVIQKLIQMLKLTTQERDEAKRQLDHLMNKAVIQPSPVSCLPPKSPRPWQSNANSTGTDSDSVSHVSSPATEYPDYAADTVADSCHAGNVAPQKLLCYNNGASNSISKYEAYARLEQIASKNLPEKGKLLEAMVKAGTPLHTLLTTGPLPQWKNPPPLQKLQIPLVSVKGRVSQAAAALSPSPLAHNNVNVVHNEMNSPMMHGAYAMKRAMVSPCSSAKRQKAQ